MDFSFFLFLFSPWILIYYKSILPKAPGSFIDKGMKSCSFTYCDIFVFKRSSELNIYQKEPALEPGITLLVKQITASTVKLIGRESTDTFSGAIHASFLNVALNSPFVVRSISVIVPSFFLYHDKFL